MGEMEDKLNAILNDPSAMGQIMALAQSLGGGAPRPQASPAGEAAQGAEQTGAREAEAPASAGSAPPALAGGEDPLAALGSRWGCGCCGSIRGRTTERWLCSTPCAPS